MAEHANVTECNDRYDRTDMNLTYIFYEFQGILNKIYVKGEITSHCFAIIAIIWHFLRLFANIAIICDYSANIATIFKYCDYLQKFAIIC